MICCFMKKIIIIMHCDKMVAHIRETYLHYIVLPTLFVHLSVFFYILFNVLFRRNVTFTLPVDSLNCTFCL